MARIFIALRFGDEVKKALVALQNALRAQELRATIVRGATST